MLNKIRTTIDSLVAKKTINPNDHYFSKQEILFTEITTNKEKVNKLILNKVWNNDLFSPRSYNEQFWDNQTILLESKEQKKLIEDLQKKVSLKEQFKQ